MKKVVAVVSTVLLTGSLAVAQSGSASGGSTKPTNVSEPDTPRPATESKDLDTKKRKKGTNVHEGAAKGHKGGKKSKKDSEGNTTTTPK